MPTGSRLSRACLPPVPKEVLMKDRLISEIRHLTQRIGQAARSGVTELAERLRISRTQLAARLARDFGTWMLVNAKGKTEFVDPETWKARVDAWKERKRLEATSPRRAPAPEASPSANNPEAAPPATDPVRELFGDPISIYTRASAISDGVLADVTSSAADLFKIPVAFTSALWAIIEDLPPGPSGNEPLQERVREVLRAAIAVSRQEPQPRAQISFPLLIGTSGGLRSLELLVHCGPGDRGEPVLTIGFPSDF
jgi:hypothetical protein